MTRELSGSLGEWVRAFGKYQRGSTAGWGVNFAGSQLVFPGRDGASFSNQAFNARIKLACERVRVLVISAHPLRHTAAALLLNERGANLCDVQALLGHKSISTTARYTHVDSERLRTVVRNLSATLVNSFIPAIYFYHSFPRHNDHELALGILRSILKNGLLLTGESRLVPGSGELGPVEFVQKRICFTAIEPSDLRIRRRACTGVWGPPRGLLHRIVV